MRYVAMSLRVALAEKFPEIPEAEILKVTVATCSYQVCSWLHTVHLSTNNEWGGHMFTYTHSTTQDVQLQGCS